MTRRTIFALVAAACFTSSGCKDDANLNSAPIVLIETSLGAIKLELAPRQAPLTVDNFLEYVDDKHYDGTVFHRVISHFMIQGGGFSAEGGILAQKETGDGVPNEAISSGLLNLTGTVAMARTGDPDSATCQFFINVADNSDLDPGSFSPDGYAVFGKVIEGMDVVERIRLVPTTTKDLHSADSRGGFIPRPAPNVPETDVLIKSVRLLD